MIKSTIYSVILLLLCFMLTGCAESNIIVTVDSAKYAVFCESKSYRNLSEFENALLEMTFENNAGKTIKVFKSVEITKESCLFENRYTLNAVTNPLPENGSIFGDNGNPQIAITMPGKINESMGGEVDGKILITELPDPTQENDITVVSTAINGTGIVITVLVIFFIIGLLYSLSDKGGE